MASSDPVTRSYSTETSTTSFEEMSRTAARAMLLPLILNFVAAHPPSHHQGEVMVVVNPRSGTVAFILGDFDGIEAVLREEGNSAASKAAIEAIPVVKVGEEGIECAICLTEFELGGDAKEMPCNHRFHSGCIDKWLGIHGSCPLCRYKLPVEDGVVNPGSGEERRDSGRRLFRVFFARSRSNSDSDENSGGGDSESAMEIDGYFN